MDFGNEYLSLRGQGQTTTVKETHQKKLMKLSERQDQPLGKQGEGSVRAHDVVELPNWEALCEIEAVAKAYAKRVKQTLSDKGVEKARKYVKSNGLVAVLYDKSVGFCVMRKETYEIKLSDTLDSNQLSKSKGTRDATVLKIERDIIKELLAMRKKDEISENLKHEVYWGAADQALWVGESA